MQTIYKYPLKSVDQQTISMPVESTILSLQVQNYTPCLWAKVDPEKPVGDRTFIIIGTGYPLPEIELDFIATYQDGPYVFHVFEIA